MRRHRFHLHTAVLLVGLVYAGLWSTQVQDEIRYERTTIEAVQQ